MGLSRKKEIEKGQALVEFALAISLLLMIIIGLLEFGFMFHAYLSLDHASLEGARVGALGGSDEEIEAKIRAAVAGTVDSTELEIKITPQLSSRKRSQPLTVILEYPQDFFTPFLGNVLGGQLHLKAKAVMRIE